MQNLLIDLDREMASTRRLLERYPDGKGTWQPHKNRGRCQSSPLMSPTFPTTARIF